MRVRKCVGQWSPIFPEAGFDLLLPLFALGNSLFMLSPTINNDLKPPNEHRYKTCSAD